MMVIERLNMAQLRRLGFAVLLSAFVGLALASCNSESSSGGIECGGAAQFLCPNNMYCDLGRTCGGVDKGGLCARLPTDCPTTDAPVCTCTGKTFSNACYANGSRETVAYDGPCVTE